MPPEYNCFASCHSDSHLGPTRKNGSSRGRLPKTDCLDEAPPNPPEEGADERDRVLGDTALHTYTGAGATPASDTTGGVGGSLASCASSLPSSPPLAHAMRDEPQGHHLCGAHAVGCNA